MNLFPAIEQQHQDCQRKTYSALQLLGFLVDKFGESFCSDFSLCLNLPFALFSIIVNVIMFVHLVERFIHLPFQRKDIGVKIIILVSNIPITFFYYLIVMKHG